VGGTGPATGPGAMGGVVGRGGGVVAGAVDVGGGGAVRPGWEGSDLGGAHDDGVGRPGGAGTDADDAVAGALGDGGAVGPVGTGPWGSGPGVERTRRGMVRDDCACAAGAWGAWFGCGFGGRFGVGWGWVRSGFLPAGAVRAPGGDVVERFAGVAGAGICRVGWRAGVGSGGESAGGSGRVGGVVGFDGVCVGRAGALVGGGRPGECTGGRWEGGCFGPALEAGVGGRAFGGAVGDVPLGSGGRGFAMGVRGEGAGGGAPSVDGVAGL